MKSFSAIQTIDLPVDQRIKLVEDIWDTIAEIPESVNFPDWHKHKLEQRLETYHADPDAGSPWNEVKARIIKE